MYSSSYAYSQLLCLSCRKKLAHDEGWDCTQISMLLVAEFHSHPTKLILMRIHSVVPLSLVATCAFLVLRFLGPSRSDVAVQEADKCPRAPLFVALWG